MKFDDIHGLDWRFISPSGEEKVFPITGYGKTRHNEAVIFAQEHPDWQKITERF